MPPSTPRDSRRRAPRHEALLRVTLRVIEAGGATTEGAAVVSSLSRSGIFVAAPTEAAIGQTVRFELMAEAGECVAVGNIIENRGRLGFAVEFQGETAGMKAFFDRIEALAPAERWAALQAIEGGVVEIV